MYINPLYFTSEELTKIANKLLIAHVGAGDSRIEKFDYEAALSYDIESRITKKNKEYINIYPNLYRINKSIRYGTLLPHFLIMPVKFHPLRVSINMYSSIKTLCEEHAIFNLVDDLCYIVNFIAINFTYYQHEYETTGENGIEVDRNKEFGELLEFFKHFEIETFKITNVRFRYEFYINKEAGYPTKFDSALSNDENYELKKGYVSITPNWYGLAANSFKNFLRNLNKEASGLNSSMVHGSHYSAPKSLIEIKRHIDFLAQSTKVLREYICNYPGISFKNQSNLLKFVKQLLNKSDLPIQFDYSSRNYFLNAWKQNNNMSGVRLK